MDGTLYPVNVLLVDDQAANLELIAMALDEQSINIFSCDDPAAAWQRCVDEKIDIALIDVHMPRIDGYELLSMIKSSSLTSHIFVVLITGQTMGSDDIVKGLGLGAVDYLFKPFDLHILNAKIKSLAAMVRQQLELESTRSRKENFLANMSHEMRTPLNSIIGLIYLLRNTRMDTEQRELLDLMDYTSATLLGVVNDVLESLKIDAGKVKLSLSTLDPRELVGRACDMLRPLAQAKGLELNCEVTPEVPLLIRGDAQRLNQVLLNLLNNGIKFTEKGTVRVTLDKLGEANGQVRLSFTITDTGIGIPETALKNIFQRFEQIEDQQWRKFGGTGLGLSIVKKLIELMDGTFHLNSEVGKGTHFCFEIGFALPDADPGSPGLQQPAALDPFDAPRVLVADDNAISRRFIGVMLQKWNIRVEFAEDGQETFVKASQNAYDLILIDRQMPGISGCKATKMIRTQLPHPHSQVPVICLSASFTEREKAEVLGAGINDFIGKPFQPSTLHQKIGLMLRRPRISRALVSDDQSKMNIAEKSVEHAAARAD